MKKFLLLFSISLNVAAQDLLVEVGQTLNVPLSSHRVWVEKSSVLKADSKNGRLNITGKKNGESLVRMGSTLLTVQVIDHERAALFEYLKRQIKHNPGLSILLAQGEIEIHGYLHSWKIWKNLLNEERFNSTYLMKARFSPLLKEKLQNHIDQDLAAQGLLSINVNTDPHLHVRLHPNQKGLDLYQKYFQKLGIPVSLLQESLTMEPSVRVHITVAEISKKFSRKLGMNWLDDKGQAKFEILPEGLVNSETLQATLTALESDGHAKLLASPNLICRSGKEAEFMAGGEFPIKMESRHFVNVVWKKYGILLRIKPTADSSGKMSLTIETEVSSLGPKMHDIPTIETNKVSSHFDISHSQVIALSGLLREQNSKGYTGLPWLSQVPILGPLFSSQDYLSQKTELVIFVRPSLINHEEAPNKNEKLQHVGKFDGNTQNL